MSPGLRKYMTPCAILLNVAGNVQSREKARMGQEIFRDLAFMRANFAYLPGAKHLVLNWDRLVKDGVFRVEMPDGEDLRDAITRRLAELDLQFTNDWDSDAD